MAPKKHARIAPSQTAAEDIHSDPPSVDASQSQDPDARVLQEAAKKNRQKTRERREQQKKKILANHEERQTQLKHEIELYLKSHDDKVREVRRPNIQRLLDLARKKRALEEKTEKCQSELDSAFLRAATQLQYALEDRVGELSE